MLLASSANSATPTPRASSNGRPALDPANPATHYRLSNVYSRLGKLEEAQAERDLHTKLISEQDHKRP